MAGGYSAEELSEMQAYLLYLSKTSRPRGLAVGAGSLPQAWRDFLSLNFGDQESMGFFIYYILTFWEK